MFTPNFLQVKIRSSKTDQCHQGDTVLVICTGKPTYPESVVECYMAKGDLVRNSELLFHPWPLINNAKKLRSNRSLTYILMFV